MIILVLVLYNVHGIGSRIPELASLVIDRRTITKSKDGPSSSYHWNWHTARDELLLYSSESFLSPGPGCSSGKSSDTWPITYGTKDVHAKHYRLFGFLWKLLKRALYESMQASANDTTYLVESLLAPVDPQFYVSVSTYFLLYATPHFPSSQVHNTICIKCSLHYEERLDIVPWNNQLVGGLHDDPVRADDLEEKLIEIFELGQQFRIWSRGAEQRIHVLSRSSSFTQCVQYGPQLKSWQTAVNGWTLNSYVFFNLPVLIGFRACILIGQLYMKIRLKSLHLTPSQLELVTDIRW